MAQKLKKMENKLDDKDLGLPLDARKEKLKDFLDNLLNVHNIVL